MVTTVLATILIGQSNPVHCAVMQGNPSNPKNAVEYNGVKTGICCPGCKDELKKEPTKYFTQAAKAGTVIGEFLFDPVSHNRMAKTDGKPFADFKGVRYYFESDANKKTFATNMAKFAAMPAKEVLKCPVTGEVVETYSKASSYIDQDGVRFYVCCAGCSKPLNENPQKYTSQYKAEAKAPAVIVPAS